MSVYIEAVYPNNKDYIDSVWDIKQDIREEDNMLNQNYKFFKNVYESGKCHIIRDEEQIYGFSVVTDNKRFKDCDYLAIIGVHPNHYRNGYGSDLLNRIKDNANEIVCHVRKNNKRAIEFYKDHGFRKSRIVVSYYNNGGDAYILRY